MGNDRRDDEAREILLAIQDILLDTAEPRVVLEAILRRAVRSSGAERGLIAEVEQGGGLRFSVLMGFREKGSRRDPDAFSRHVFQLVMSSGELVHIPNVLADPRFSDVESVRALNSLSLLCLPLRLDGAVVALLHLEDAREDHFQAGHLEKLRTLVDLAESALGAVRAARQSLEQRSHREREIRRSAEEERLWVAEEFSFGRYIGHSPPVRELERFVRKAAATEFPVLLLGEPGTGKELLAHVLHTASPRSQRPFVTVFCPMLETGRVESELFGSRRGAYTGATDSLGRVQLAEGGTLFFDEIGELPLEVQPKLLRLLETKKFERVGEPRESQADVRIIAATNRDLAAEVERGRFRRDLFDRLNFLPVRVPALRQRREDIPRILRHCLDQDARGRWVGLTREGEEWLVSLDHPWPGNVRDLWHIAAHLVVEASEEPVGVEELTRAMEAVGLLGSGAPSDDGRGESASGLSGKRQEAERASIVEAMRLHPNVSRAELARILQVSQATLFRRLRDYGLSE